MAEPEELFNWIGCDSRGVPYHLHALNLMWSDSGADHDLSVFAAAAEQLAADPPLWSAVLRNLNWRLPLLGCACLLVRPTPGFASDLAFRFEAGSMVSPQIAVTAGLVYPEAAAEFMTTFLAGSRAAKRPRDSVAAEEVLARLGRPSEPGLPRTARWPSFSDVDEIALSEQVVAAWWSFWSRRTRHAEPATASNRQA